jgi:basic amino acid/polyamine antiporter, APA family
MKPTNSAALETSAAPAAPLLDRALGPIDGVAIVVGTVIGSGIFVVPAAIAGSAGQFGMGTVLLVWVVCGALSLAGALSYAELASMFPRAGGQYVFLREAYGPKWAFLFGWMEFWIARSGSAAAIAVGFALYAAQFTGRGDPWGVRLTALAVIVSLTVVNYLGVRWGGWVQRLFTAAKVAALVALVVAAFVLPVGTSANWSPWVSLEPGWLPFIGLFGFAMIQALWAFDGWTNAATVAEEIREPRRSIPFALVWGTLGVTLLYLVVNLGYHYVLSQEDVAGTERVAALTAERLLGPIGAALVAAAVMISTFGSTNGTLLTGPRIFYAMARDGAFFPAMRNLHPRFHTPHLAIAGQGAWASLLVLAPVNEVLRRTLGWELETPLFDQLLTFVIFASWAFYGMTVAGVLVLRRRSPDLERPYRAWGYPVVPLLFVLTTIAFVGHVLWHNPVESAAGVAIVLLGLPAYAWWRREAP